jgi:glycerophosphoryl diester phosphodiesterase
MRTGAVRRFALCLLAPATFMTSSSVLSLDLQGHRGARGLLPENSLPAFARALAIGITTLELDCAITRDGVLVVSHDPVLNPDITRGPDGQWLEGNGPPIKLLGFAELQRYDVGRIRPGTAYAKRFSRQQPLDGIRIPALADVFALVRKSENGTVRFNIETKVSPLEPAHTATPDVFARALIAAIRKEKMAARTAIQSFDWRTLAVVQKEAPEIMTVYLTAQQDFLDNIRAKDSSSPWTAPLHISQFGGSLPKMIKAAGGAVWSPYFQEVVPASVREAQALGLKVVVWTVNEEADMMRMIALGVDGIISDYPDRLRKVAGKAGVTLPAATPVAP